MKLITLSLVALISLFGTMNHSSARTIDSCVSLEGISDVSRLQQELNKADIPYRTDPKVLCVSQEHRDKYYRLVRKVSPPKPNVSRNIKVPPSPSGIPLQSVTLTDPVQHEMLQKELKRQRIWHKIDENGALWYEVTKEKQVSELIFNIIESDIPIGNLGSE